MSSHPCYAGVSCLARIRKLTHQEYGYCFVTVNCFYNKLALSRCEISGSRNDTVEAFGLPGCYAAYDASLLRTFRDNQSPETSVTSHQPTPCNISGNRRALAQYNIVLSLSENKVARH